MARVFCDVQMLRNAEGSYIVKEFSVYDAEWDACKTVSFLPPHAESLLPLRYQTQNTFVTNHINGLAWDSGYIPYDQCHQTLYELTKTYTFIYVKGEQKRKLLNSILNREFGIFNIEDLGCPKLSNLPRLVVPYHGIDHLGVPYHACAEINARRIGLWLTMILATPFIKI